MALELHTTIEPTGPAGAIILTDARSPNCLRRRRHRWS